MIALRAIAVILLLSSACGGPPPLQRIESLALERTTCYGWCPSYKIVVSGDGHAVYEGRKFVKELGRREKRLSERQLLQLAEEVRRVNYFGLRDQYASEEDGCPTRWTDNPSAITSVKAAGRLKRIGHYYGCQYETGSRRGVYPEELTTFESRVDQIVGVVEWIGSEKERAETATRR